MKATRKGMALKMSSFEILLSNPPRLIKKPEEFEETYYYCEYPLEGFPYRIAVCSNDSELDSRIQMELKRKYGKSKIEKAKKNTDHRDDPWSGSRDFCSHFWQQTARCMTKNDEIKTVKAKYKKKRNL